MIVGAGFAGMYMLHCLRELGFSARVFEVGSDVGGTWYWNRYPGARCDIESLQYSYSFSEELDQEWEWTERYAPQPDILAYANHVADRFDLRRDIRFDTRVTALAFDEAEKRWNVETDADQCCSARFCIMAVGCLSAANRPHFDGLDLFEGEVLHTGEWPHEPVDFSGRRVAVIGTGSSAIQSIPVIAAQAATLTVFQRTPNYAVPAWNAPLDPERVRAIKADYPGFRVKARSRPTGFYFPYNTRPALDSTPEERRRQYEESWGRGGLPFLGRLRRPAVRQGGQRHGRRVRAREDPRCGRRSDNGGTALPGQCVRLQAALRRYRLLRDLQSGPCGHWSMYRSSPSSGLPPEASLRTARNIPPTRRSSRQALRR